MTTPRLTLTYAQAKADLTEIAEAAPDRSLPDMGGYCTYFATERLVGGDLKPGEGCCIVGRVLEKHGLTVDDLQIDVDGDHHYDLNEGNTVRDLEQYGVLGLDSDALTLLSEAQAIQDTGTSWGDAVRLAIAEVESTA